MIVELQKAIERLAAEYECGRQFVSIRYECEMNDGAPEWGWLCVVREKTKKHGGGRRLVRPQSTSFGLTLEEAVAESVRKAPFYKAEMEAG